MTVSFTPDAIPATPIVLLGTESGFVASPPRRSPQIIHLAGANGDLELRMGRGLKQISFPFWVHSSSFTSLPLLENYLIYLDSLVDAHGTIEIANPENEYNRQWANATIDGFFPESGAIQDETGWLDGSWFVRGRFQFIQLSLDTVAYTPPEV